MYNESNVEPFIVFRIATYLFALPIGDVLQVVPYPPQSSDELRQVGLVQLGHYTIKLVDLHRQCHSEDVSPLPGSQSFVVLTRDPQGGFCGILVYEPPDMMEFPPEKMRSLPQSEHQFGVLKIARCAAILSWKEVTTTIFLFDVQQALTMTPTGSHFLVRQQ
jgi:chemotaxis signal transduction protein